MSGTHDEHYVRRPGIHYGLPDTHAGEPSPTWRLALTIRCEAHDAEPGQPCWTGVTSMCGSRTSAALSLVRAGHRP